MNPEKAFPFRYNKSTVIEKDIKSIIYLNRKVGTIFRIGEDGWYYTPTEKQRWIGVFDPESGADYIWDKATNSVWWSVDEDGCALAPPTSKNAHVWMQDGSPIGNAHVWTRASCKQLEVRPPTGSAREEEHGER